MPTHKSSRRSNPIDFTVRLEKQLGSFFLDVAWFPHARRLAILGPSGSGKSLTLKLMAGIEHNDRGFVTVNGRDVSQLDPAARSMAYVPQNYGLFPHLTVIEQLRFPVGADVKRALHWIDRFGLRGLEQRLPSALSMGQHQRVALARALTKPADIILLDEPFSALDTPLRSSLRQELLALQDEIDCATIIVTHDPAEAAILADEILVLERGRVLQAGPTEQVFRRPANEMVARLIGAENVGRGVVTGKHTIAIGRGVVVKVADQALRPGELVGWSFSPAQAQIKADGRYQGFVEFITVAGIERHVTVRVGDARVRILERTGDDVLRDDRCSFDIDPDAIQVWPADQTG
jgi:ABC-type Fe3+/spermidine/putrescine transport system ATPase subunit